MKAKVLVDCFGVWLIVDTPSGNNANDTSAQNDWKGAWWHSSLSLHSGFVAGDSPYESRGSKGTFYFEFSRPLRTVDRFQQDAQFKLGESSKFSAAFWYPVDADSWHGSSHFTIKCDWLPLDFVSGGSGTSASPTQQPSSKSSWDAAVAFSLPLSVVAFCVSVFVRLKVSKNPGVAFTPMNNL